MDRFTDFAYFFSPLQLFSFKIIPISSMLKFFPQNMSLRLVTRECALF